MQQAVGNTYATWMWDHGEAFISLPRIYAFLCIRTPNKLPA